MAFGTSKKISVDLCRNKHVSTRVAQYDKDSRDIIIQLTNDGVPYTIDLSKVEIRIKYLKGDGKIVFNDISSDNLLSDGTIKLTLTDQMCVAYGNAEAEIMLREKSTGKTLHTKHFIVNVEKAVFSDDDISSTNEFIALDNLLIRVEIAEKELERLDKLVTENEKVRQANEEERKVSEEERKNAENIRKEEEAKREIAEIAREISEENRNNAESIRNTNEEKREIEESKRNEAENERNENEEIRKANEIVREENETERKNGYTEMQNQLSQMNSDLDNHINDTSNPHKVSLEQLGIPLVENKSSEIIRSEITKDNVTTALGYVPYSPSEVDNKFSALESNIVWKETVDTYDDILITYPNPIDGWTVNVKDTDYTYRFDGEKWVVVSANAIPKATSNVDGLLTKEDFQKLSNISENASSVSFNSTLTSGLQIGVININGTNYPIYAPEGNTSEIVTESIDDEPSNQKEGEYWAFNY